MLSAPSASANIPPDILFKSGTMASPCLIYYNAELTAQMLPLFLHDWQTEAQAESTQHRRGRSVCKPNPEVRLQRLLDIIILSTQATKMAEPTVQDTAKILADIDWFLFDCDGKFAFLNKV